MCEHEEEQNGVKTRCPFKEAPGGRLCAMHAHVKSEPTFTYSSKDMEDLARDKAAKEAVRVAVISEARAHQWEHKGPTGLLSWVCICGASGPGLALPPAHAACRDVQERAYRNAVDGRSAASRTFTREEVLTALRFHKAGIGSSMGYEAAHACMDRLISTFERME